MSETAYNFLNYLHQAKAGRKRENPNILLLTTFM